MNKIKEKLENVIFSLNLQAKSKRSPKSEAEIKSNLLKIKVKSPDKSLHKNDFIKEIYSMNSFDNFAETAEKLESEKKFFEEKFIKTLENVSFFY